MVRRHDTARTTAEGLTQAIDRLRSTPIAQIRRFDASMRDRSLSEPWWFPGMLRIDPNDVADVIDAAHDPAGAALVLACHSNGRVREQALGSRAYALDPYSLAILVLRSADWVPLVRDAADRAFAATWSRSSEDSKLSPTSSPRTSRDPSAVIPVATTTAIDVTCEVALRTCR